MALVVDLYLKVKRTTLQGLKIWYDGALFIVRFEWHAITLTVPFGRGSFWSVKRLDFRLKKSSSNQFRLSEQPGISRNKGHDFVSNNSRWRQRWLFLNNGNLVACLKKLFQCELHKFHQIHSNTMSSWHGDIPLTLPYPENLSTWQALNLDSAKRWLHAWNLCSLQMSSLQRQGTGCWLHRHQISTGCSSCEQVDISCEKWKLHKNLQNSDEREGCSSYIVQ